MSPIKNACLTCTDRINIHVQNAPQDFPHFEQIAESALFEKVRQIFEYSLHDTVVSRFRKMLTIKQFRSPELAALFSRRYVDRIIDYHARIFKDLIAAGELAPGNPKTLSLLYVAPIIMLLGVRDRRSEREEECLVRLENHVRLFFHQDFLIFFSARNRKHVILVMYPRTIFVFLMFLP